MAGAASVAGVLSATGAALAVVLNAGVPQCATAGAIVGAIAGSIGGAIGGCARGATGRPPPVGRGIAASAVAVPLVLGLVWGPLPERLVILAFAIPGLWVGAAIGDRAAKGVVRSKPTPGPPWDGLDDR